MNVQVYTEPGVGSVNSSLVDVGEGLFIIDGQRFLSSARRLHERIQQAQKPVIGLALTHPHPDHMGGLSVLA
jgi:glyoxylase-like metal-dependent hydrolase (beta-lactamase superfamily II)